MKNLLAITGAKALSKTEQKQVTGGGGGPVGEYDDCHENDPGIGNQCLSNSNCAQNQVCVSNPNEGIPININDTMGTCQCGITDIF